MSKQTQDKKNELLKRREGLKQELQERIYQYQREETVAHEEKMYCYALQSQGYRKGLEKALELMEHPEYYMYKYKEEADAS